MTRPDHIRRPRLPRGKPFAHFQWNYGWGHWEQVIDEAAGRRGVVAAYAHSPAENSADDGAPTRHTLSAQAELSRLQHSLSLAVEAYPEAVLEAMARAYVEHIHGASRVPPDADLSMEKGAMRAALDRAREVHSKLTESE